MCLTEENNKKKKKTAHLMSLNRTIVTSLFVIIVRVTVVDNVIYNRGCHIKSILW